VIEEQGGETRINRKYYELCVLQKLKRALKCKEIWVEGAEEFRNPAQDLPREWDDEEKRGSLYQILKQPVEVSSFLDPLRDRLMKALKDFDRALPGHPYICIQRPKGNPERGLFKLAKLDPQPEPQSLGIIKDAIGKRYEMLDLLDVFLEADRLVNFTRHFTHSGTKEVRSREELRPLIILDLFAEGTNTGIKRVANANHHQLTSFSMSARTTSLRRPSGAQTSRWSTRFWPYAIRVCGVKDTPALPTASALKAGART
jgi:hypothetical protein